MRSWLVFVALAGCDYALRIDKVPAPISGDAAAPDSRPDNCTTAKGTFTPASCSSVAFGGTPVELTELDGEVAGDPSMRGDRLELFYATYDQGYRLAYATRPDETSKFAPQGAPPFADATATEADPSVSADGSYVAFVSNRGGSGEHPYLAHRACDTWEVVPMPGLETTQMVGVELSYDALALYFSTPAEEIFESRRLSTDEAFGAPLPVATQGAYPAISSDELELYFTPSSGGGVKRATRANIGVAFDTPTVATAFGADPDLTPDGRTLVLWRTGDGAQVLQRNCP